jgi:hypothetical protein
MVKLGVNVGGCTGTVAVEVGSVLIMAARFGVAVAVGSRAAKVRSADEGVTT